MAKQINCSHCTGRNLKPTGDKRVYECKNCGGITDATDWRDFAAKATGAAVGVGVGILTLGLIPEEVGDSIANNISDFFEGLV